MIESARKGNNAKKKKERRTNKYRGRKTAINRHSQKKREKERER